MSAKVQGKQPETVDLTGSSPVGHAPASRAPRNHPKDIPPATAFQPHTGAKKLVIKNLRVNPRREEVEKYYARTWADLDAAVAAIFAGQRPSQPLERLYRGVEDLCLHKQAQQLYVKLRTQVETYLYGEVLAQMREEVQAAGVTDVEALRIVYRFWQTWSSKSTVIVSTFSYLNRSYLATKRDLEQISDMLINRFRRTVFLGGKEGDESTAPGKRVLAGMCELVAQSRRGDAAFDAHLLRESVAMLHVFGVYGRYFEPEFLRQSEAYLKEFAEEKTAAGDLKQYLVDCEALLQREDERCNAYSFDSSTKVQLLSTAQQLLIEERAEQLTDKASVAKLLDAQDAGAMKTLYELLRLCKLQKQLRRPWESYIEATGGGIVLDTSRKGDDMVVRLLLLRRTLDVMIRDAFGRDEEFTKGLREAFGHFINDNRGLAAVWTRAGKSKVGEMIAKHIDLLLRGGLKTLPEALRSDSKDRTLAERSGQASTADEDAELDRQLDMALELIRFLEGKDVFEAFYKKDLARRLLMGRSASHDAERNMLSKLKTECGSILTHNLEQMFKDQEVSRDEMTAYKEYRDDRRRDAEATEAVAAAAGDDAQGPDRAGGRRRKKRGAVDLQVSVLSEVSWPSYPDVHLNLPPEVVEQIELFDAYYNQKHTGRKLKWRHALGQCVMEARFKRGVKELMISSFQAAVLLLFNQVEEGGAKEPSSPAVLSYSQIRTATGLEGAELDRTLQSLACGKVRVLAKTPKGREIGKDDTFAVNQGFADPRVRIKINQIQLKETVEENTATYERVAADRQFETQAAIVRIMKSRKSLPHAQLVAEVISQTKSRGALDPADIKQNIEKLIEKDYLDREGGNYVYLA